MIVLVTGLMRSGTSAVAQMLHDLGVPMGVSMLFPHPGTRPEYEDAVLSLYLAKLAIRRERPALDSLSLYIDGRTQAHGERWGVKTPFLLPYVGLFKKAAKGTPVKVIRTERAIGETLESLENIGRKDALDSAIKVQMRLSKAKTPESDLVVRYKDIMESPEEVIASLCGILGD